MNKTPLSQVGRIYKLTVGNVNTGKGFEVQDLTISFEVVKSSDNSKKNANNANISIYNLSRDNQAFLERTPYIRATLEVGYIATGLTRIISGEVVITTTVKQGDGSTITDMRFEGSYKDLNLSQLSKTISPNRTCREAIEEIAVSIPEVSRNVFNGNAINTKLIYGYPLHSSARRSLDDLAKCYNFEWQIDNETLYINDLDGVHTRNTKRVYVLNESSGLIGRPYPVLTSDMSVKKTKGVDRPKLKQLELKILLNPTLVAGSAIKIQYEDIDGLYKVDEVRHYGSNASNEWYSDLRVSMLPT